MAVAIERIDKMFQAHGDYLANRYRPVIVLQSHYDPCDMTMQVQYQTPDGTKAISPKFDSIEAMDKWFEAIIALEQ